MEEAEELKRELPRLENRIDATKRQLAIEIKVRDAASNLSKLDKGAKRGTGDRPDPKNEEEITTANLKCENLAQDLWQLEKRQQDVQRKLLEHTAGILSMTHKGNVQQEPPPQLNGFVKHADGFDLDFSSNFDDQSFYQTLDSMLDVSMENRGSASYKKQTEAIQAMERRLRDFNQGLRDAIAQASGGRSDVPNPPDISARRDSDDIALEDQVSYLEGGFAHIQRAQSSSLQSYKTSAQGLEERLEDLNGRLRGVLLNSSLDQNLQFPLPPQMSGRGAEEQVAFLDQALEPLEHHVYRLREDHHTISSRSNNYEQKATSYEHMLQGLWESMSDGEKYSDEAFSSKVSSLSTRVADLVNQKEILKRQIEQQREINSKSDDDKDAKLSSTLAELGQAKQSAEQAREDTESLRQEMQEVEGEIVRLQTELTVARAELDGAYGTRAQRAAEVAQHPALQQEIADLKQELENAQMKASESDQLQQQAQTLRKELSETISEYETMTKASIEFEKERETLENAADSLRDRCDVLETQLGEEKLSKLGMKSPGTPGDRGSNEKGATSTSVLKNEFKKMMRETRQENMRVLRVSKLLPNALLSLTRGKA